MMAARLSQIDYSREMSFVAITPSGSADAGDILGIARMIADPNNERAEFAVIMVRSDWRGAGGRIPAPTPRLGRSMAMCSARPM